MREESDEEEQLFEISFSDNEKTTDESKGKSVEIQFDIEKFQEDSSDNEVKSSNTRIIKVKRKPLENDTKIFKRKCDVGRCLPKRNSSSKKISKISLDQDKQTFLNEKDIPLHKDIQVKNEPIDDENEENFADDPGVPTELEYLILKKESNIETSNCDESNEIVLVKKGNKHNNRESETGSADVEQKYERKEDLSLTNPKDTTELTYINCPQCLKLCKPEGLARHARRNHRSRLYTCSQCEASFLRPPMHVPEFLEKIGKCRRKGCSGKSNIICQNCRIYLCVEIGKNCFELHHENNM